MAFNDQDGWQPDVRFTSPEAWSWDYFGVVMTLADVHSEPPLDALRALWAHPDLHGCWLEYEVDHLQQNRVGPEAAIVTEPAGSAGGRPVVYFASFHGFARIPGGAIVPCLCYVLGPYDPPSPVGVALKINFRALDRVWPRDRPARSGAYGLLIEWLAGVARTVHVQTPLRYGVIGGEECDCAEPPPAESGPGCGFLIPDGTSLTLLPPAEFFFD